MGTAERQDVEYLDPRIELLDHLGDDVAVAAVAAALEAEDGDPLAAARSVTRWRAGPAGGGRLDRASNDRVSSWIADHIRVAIAPYDDRDTVGAVEGQVVYS